MNVIFVIRAAQAFFLPFLIFNKAEKSTADYVLASWFVLVGLAPLARSTGKNSDFKRPDPQDRTTCTQGRCKLVLNFRNFGISR